MEISISEYSKVIHEQTKSCPLHKTVCMTQLKNKTELEMKASDSKFLNLFEEIFAKLFRSFHVSKAFRGFCDED
jgi:hypothetical protein